MKCKIMADDVPVMIWMSDREKHVKYLNKEWLQFTGKKLEDELNDERITGIFPEDLEGYRNQYNKAFDERKSYKVEYRLKNSQGDFKWILEQGAPLYDYNQQFIGYIGSCIDITDVKKVTEILIEGNLELEQKVKQCRADFQKMSNALQIEDRIKIENELKKSHEQMSALASYIESAREEERKSIAREIHDELGQLLTAIKIELSLLLKKCQKDGHSDEEINKDVENMSNLVDRSLHSVKKIISQLRPVDIEEFGLLSEIELFVEEFSRRTNIKVKLNAEELHQSLENEKAMEVFRILQESLTNVARHSNADKVEINIRSNKEVVFFEVKDNGRGIAGVDLQNPNSFGMLGMKERANIIGGDLIIHSVPNAGTSVILTLPKKNIVKTS